MRRTCSDAIFGAFTAAFAMALGTGAASGSCPAAPAADQLCVGARIDAANLDRAKDKKFAGHRLGDMLLEKIEWQIRDYGLALALRDAVPYASDPRFVAATEQYSSGVKMEPGTHKLLGWIAGTPFPKIDPADAEAGWKIAWNQNIGEPHGDAVERSRFVYLLIDGTKGIERLQYWGYRRIFMRGRYADGGPPTLGDGTIHYKSLYFGLGPQDIKGIGSFAIRYDTGQVDDSWAYLRDQRRVRRLSGGAWHDPVGGTDYLTDDFDVFGGYPTWYPAHRLIGKRTILAVGQSETPFWVDGPENPIERFPAIDLAQAPYWHPKSTWAPHDVYVVEQTLPEEHSYSRRIAYIDSTHWGPHFGEIYDKKGDFQKWIYQVTPAQAMADGSGQSVYWSTHGAIIDYRRMHATVFVGDHDSKYSGPLKVDDVSLAILEAQGK